MRSRLRPAARRILERAPLALLLLSLSAGLIAYGIAIQRYGIFPSSILEGASKTLEVTVESRQRPDTGAFQTFTDTALTEFSARRIEVVEGDSLADAMLVYGGRHQFRELCPEHGCLAVAITRSGEVAHAWPFRPNAIHAANVVDEGDYPYEFNDFSPERDMEIAGVAQYPDGDLLVTFHLRDAFPYAGGVARIDRDGQPRWFRRDYSHHWPLLLEDGTALVPALALSDTAIDLAFGASGEGSHTITLPCRQKTYLSAVNVVDGAGAVLKRISVTDAVLDSPWRGVLHESVSPCDLLHLNNVDRVRDEPGLPDGIHAGDLVLSFRNVSAFAILDRDDYRVKRLIRGSFFQQHGVRHLDGSRFLLFDNLGGDETGGPSRLLMVDLATGAETTIFPNARTPEPLRDLFSILRGMIAISPDRQRAIVTFTRSGTSVEARLADGEVLAVFRSLHDVSDLEQFPDERLGRAALFWTFGLDYLRDDAWPER